MEEVVSVPEEEKKEEVVPEEEKKDEEIKPFEVDASGQLLIAH